MRTKEFRREQNKIQDLRRRRFYRNHAINGRFELSGKEDPSISYGSVINYKGDMRWAEVQIHPSKLTDDVGHWQEFPKNQNYGSRGYNLKSSKHKKVRKALKIKVREDIDNES